jgi:hypothetical protein
LLSFLGPRQAVEEDDEDEMRIIDDSRGMMSS